MKMHASCTLLCAAMAAQGHAQVVLNEVFENPPGGTDEFYEYIELLGRPGMSLDGFAIALLKGGSSDVLEIDEAYRLDGLSLGANGLLILVNDTGGGTLLPAFPPETSVATFSDTHIPTSDTPGNLANDDSSTYVLVRARPGTSGPFGTDWRKEAMQDVNLDSLVDFPIIPGAFILEPYQMVDDIAWSHNMGLEYTRQGIDELDDTKGFNPDAITRLRYFGDAGPGPGNRAEEEWLRGDVTNLVTFPFDSTRVGSPEGVDPTGATLTPGDLNNSASIVQFAFVPGDINFSGGVDSDDLVLAQSLLGASLDDREDCIDADGNPIVDPDTGLPYPCYTYQGRSFNTVESLRTLDLTDGPGGENADEVTSRDIDALAALVGGCEADLDGDADADADDFFAYLDAFASGNLGVCDADNDGDCDADDFFGYLDQFAQGC